MRARHRLAAVAHRLGVEVVRPEQVAKQLEVEFVVLDNEYALRHGLSVLRHPYSYYSMCPFETIDDDAGTLALRALAWTLADQGRAERLLALTGLDPETLRGRAGDRDMMIATLSFLEGYEPDMIACADALGVAPAALAAARRTLEAPR